MPVAHQVPLGLWEALSPLQKARGFAAGSPLFKRGQSAKGVFLLRSGRVRLVAPGGTVGRQQVRVAEAGSVLGLCACVSGDTYAATAEAAEPILAGFVPRAALVQFLASHQKHCMEVVRLFSEDLHVAYRSCQDKPPASRTHRKAARR